jgi:hypothetical protein
MYIGRRIPFGKSDHRYSFGRVVHGARIVGNALANVEKLPEVGEETGPGAEAVVGIAGEVAAERRDEAKRREIPPLRSAS